MSIDQKIRCLVLDDEPLAAQLLSEYIKQTPGLELAGIFTKPLDALQWIENNSADILFLDVQMPQITGVQVMKILNGKLQVILVTAYPEYAIEGFEYNALDYLVKPAAFERFLVAIQKFHGIHNKVKTNTTAKTEEESHLFVKAEYKILRIPFDDILYLQGLRDYVAIITKEKKILTLQSLRSFEESLPSERFMRIHRSYIISLNQVNYVERNRVYIQSTPLPISDTYKPTFNQRINK
ncbi:MAG: LytTR family DNA-binding domain-containing protein [Flavobacteriales bacterium]|nr:LytTR family DNA-binding domain-containing protein [Flavobacteriales bacterium]